MASGWRDPDDDGRWLAREPDLTLRLLGRLPALLDRRWLPPAAILIARLLVSPSLGVGRMGDDFMQMARVDPQRHAPGLAYVSLDLSTFTFGVPLEDPSLLWTRLQAAAPSTPGRRPLWARARSGPQSSRADTR